MNKKEIEKIAKNIVAEEYGHETLIINMQLLNAAYRYENMEINYDAVGESICKLGQKIKSMGDSITSLNDANGNKSIIVKWE